MRNHSVQPVGRYVACHVTERTQVKEINMRKNWIWTSLLALPLAVGGWVYAGVQTNPDSPSNEGGFVCPVTGEELPCPKCCPLK